MMSSEIKVCPAKELMAIRRANLCYIKEKVLIVYGLAYESPPHTTLLTRGFGK